MTNLIASDDKVDGAFCEVQKAVHSFQRYVLSFFSCDCSCAIYEKSKGVYLIVMKIIKDWIDEVFQFVYHTAQTIKNSFMEQAKIFVAGVVNRVAYQRITINQQDNWFSVPYFSSIDANRIKKSNEALDSIGGTRSKLILDNQLGTFETMYFKAIDFFNIIDSLGGRCIRYPLTDKNSFALVIEWENEKAKIQLQTLLKPFHISSKEVELEHQKLDCFFLGEYAFSGEESKKCILNCPANGRLFSMDKKLPFDLLALGHDVLVFDWPGVFGETRQSEAVYQQAVLKCYEKLKELNYKDESIVVTGACLSGAVAASIKVQFPRTHLLLRNSFASIHHLVDSYTPFWRSITLLGLEAGIMDDRDPSIEQDCFNTAKKIATLAQKTEKSGFIGIFQTDKDPFIPKDTLTQLQKAANSTILLHSYLHPLTDSAINPHLIDPFKSTLGMSEFLKLIDRVDDEKV